MPILSANLSLRYGGRFLPSIPNFTSLSIDEDMLSERRTLTSNQSNVAVNFGPVATATAVFLTADQSGTYAFDSGTAYTIETNGWVAIMRTSMSALTLTNLQTNTEMQTTIYILGS